MSQNHNQKLSDIGEKIESDEMSKKLKDIVVSSKNSTNTPFQIFEEADKKVTPEKDDMIKIIRLLETLEARSYGENIPWNYDINILPLYVIKIVSRINRKKGHRESFIGEYRLHKIIYFLSQFKLDNLKILNFNRLNPWGVYSVNLTKKLDVLKKEKLLKIEKSDNSERKQFVLTPIGKEKLVEIENDLYNKYEDISKLENFIIDLYRYDFDTLGKASKKHFTKTYWDPILAAYTDERIDLMKETLYAKYNYDPKIIDDAVELLKETLKEFAPPPREKVIARTEGMRMPEDQLTASLQEDIPRDSFLPDRIFFIKGSGVPTNYFIPVNVYKYEPALIRLIAEKYKKFIPQGILRVVILNQGISEIIAIELKNLFPDLSIIGPVKNSDTGEYLLDISVLEKGNVVLLANTVQTGRSLVELIKKFKNIEINVVSVIAFADRGIGAKYLIDKENGIPFDSFLSKDKLVDLFRERFLLWTS